MALRSLVFLSFLIVSVVVAFAEEAVPPPAEALAPVAPTIPTFSIKSLTGTTFTHENVIGDPTLMIFFTPDCPVCTKEFQKISEFYSTMKGVGISVIAIAFKDTEAQVRKYADQYARYLPYPVLHDVDGSIARRFGIEKTPTFMFYNQTGQREVTFYGSGLFEHPTFEQTMAGKLFVK